MKVYLDPRCDIRYAVFYIYGLYKVLGKKNVIFSSKYSKEVSFDEFNSVIDRILLCTFVKNGKIVKKVAIDSRDPRSFLEKAYKWCDIYAKTNFRDLEDNEIHRCKLQLLPPSFGFKLWNTPMTIFQGMRNTYLAYKTGNYGTINDLKVTFRNYIWLILRRQYLKLYERYNEGCKYNYAFFVASLWNYEECIKYTNKLRYDFANLLNSDSDIDFEGGFIIHSLSAKIPENWRMICHSKRISAKDYIKKTKQSFVVFNTPAVRECHGWKLPEYLAMGKAIISTPLINDLPVDLEDRKHLHIVKSNKEMKQAINILKQDVGYRIKLQISAKRYWEEVAKPEKVICSIISNF